MEKAKTKLIHDLIFKLSFAGVCIMLFIQFLYKIISAATPNITVVYWLILIAWIFYIIKRGFTGKFSLAVAFFLYLTGIVLYVLRFVDIAETIMKLAFIGLTVGVSQIFIENLRKNGNKNL